MTYARNADRSPVITPRSARSFLRRSCPATFAAALPETMAEDDQQQQYLDHINGENDALEAEIMRLSQAKMAETKQLAAPTVKPVRAPGSGICVLDFGALDHAEAAGIDRGSAWRPTQTKRRTLSGGFFTS